ncbi:MAG: glycoside hydrolase family 78 protein [Anaerolineae bacterium]
MLTVQDLRCEYHRNPLGIDARQPRLSWRLSAEHRGAVQSAYQIRVEDQEGNELWDTGKVAGDRSIHVRYEGPPLRSGQRYTWRIRAWDAEDAPSAWSAPAWWEMGLLEPADWRAGWIEPDWEVDPKASKPCPYMRRTFRLDGQVRLARAYVTSHGLYELSLNGQRVGDQVFTPGFSSYHDRLQYQVYDVGDLLIEGENAVGAILGDGWYRGSVDVASRRNVYGERLALLLQIHVRYEDGREAWVTSDEEWRATTGPILKSDLKDGEIYDARREMPGWDSPGFDDGDWRGVRVGDYGYENLVAPVGPPVRKQERFPARRVLHTPKGEWVVDLGQNIAGWLRFEVQGLAGTTVTLTHGEALDKDGSFTLDHLQLAGIGARLEQQVRYTLKGGGVESYEPHFTVHGYRYVKVEGWPGDPAPEQFTGVAIYSDMPPTGTFECSDERINQLQHNIVWSMKGNFLDVPTDCPTRERSGWTGDAQIFCRTGSFLMETAPFFRAWLRDLAADQHADGCVPNWVPDTTRYYDDKVMAMLTGSAGWGDAAVIVPWTLYQCYGDIGILEEQYESMRAWVEYERAHARDVNWSKVIYPGYWFDRARQARQPYIWDTRYHWGEWLEPGDGYGLGQFAGMLKRRIFSVPLVATAYYAYSTRLLAETARLLGKEEDAREYGELAAAIAAAYADEFVGPDIRIEPHKQASYVRALALDLLPQDQRRAALVHLVRLIEDAGVHLGTGFLSTPFLLHVLSEGGRLDLAYALLVQDTIPSWLYAVTKGATTIWESWEGVKEDGSLFGSLNHYSYGAVGSWLYQVVAGIEIGAPGYEEIRIQPRPGGGLTYARATYESMHGLIASAWEIEGGTLRLSVTIPPNTRATVRLPGATLDEVQEGDVPLEQAEGIRSAEQVAAAVQVQLGSGQYVFSYPYHEVN